MRWHKPGIVSVHVERLVNDGLLERQDNPGEYMMTGGVAKNKGITNALEEKLGAKLYICDEAQLCGALGAALFAYEKCREA